MKLDYGTQISPTPIRLTIGSIRKPKLSEIAEISFEKFGYYEFLIKMTPEIYYTIIKNNGDESYWNSLPDDEKREISLYHIITSDGMMTTAYAEMLGFFFIEPIVYQEGYFLSLKNAHTNLSEIDIEDIAGVITEENFTDVIDILRQICCIEEEKEEEKEPKFKNDLAKQMFEKMKRARKAKKADKNMTIPNIISAVSNRHPTISPLNIWGLTIFQLLDSFKRMQVNELFDINKTTVSVWGDEKNTFDISLWYKNEHDKIVV